MSAAAHSPKTEARGCRTPADEGSAAVRRRNFLIGHACLTRLPDSPSFTEAPLVTGESRSHQFQPDGLVQQRDGLALFNASNCAADRTQWVYLRRRMGTPKTESSVDSRPLHVQKTVSQGPGCLDDAQVVTVSGASGTKVSVTHATFAAG